MSDNWVVQNLQNSLNTWNKKLAEVWQLLTQSPENFKGGAIWDVILKIHGALLAIGLALLIEMGYDIVEIKGSPNKYFWGSRTFEIPELKMLVDAVSSARFITKKKSEALIEKIALLAGDSQYEHMSRHIVATGRAKSDNKRIYYIVDTITDAINQQKKIQFKLLPKFQQP